MLFFLIDRVIQKEGLYLYNMHNILQKHSEYALRPCEAGAGR
jgi:hypothetical protein